MSAEAAAAVRKWKAGAFTCTLTLQRPKPGALVHACVEWHPSVPIRLTAAELAEYRAGRDRALAELSHALGINAAVIDL